jgi:hypothetical protein
LYRQRGVCGDRARQIDRGLKCLTIIDDPIEQPESTGLFGRYCLTRHQDLQRGRTRDAAR